MTDKKTTETKAKEPVELKEEDLENAQGGVAGGGGHDSAGPLDETKAGKTQLPLGFFTDFDNR